jgi:hypothetical protein
MIKEALLHNLIIEIMLIEIRCCVINTTISSSTANRWLKVYLATLQFYVGISVIIGI